MLLLSLPSLHPSGIALCFAVALLPVSSGFWIDPASCHDNNGAYTMTTAMNAAKAIIEDASTHISAQFLANPANAKMKNLASLIFGNDDSISKARGEVTTYDTDNDFISIRGKQAIEGPDDHAFSYSDTQVGALEWSGIVVNPVDLQKINDANARDLTIPGLVAILKDVTKQVQRSAVPDHVDGICISQDTIVAHEVCILSSALQSHRLVMAGSMDVLT
ncbi:hypothetical protein BDV95DRAFT_673020 [Massariosphaeria phaeospora]|uniref:Uncharacterized protein n=1 Tax=Massariosphaeria phaeospora TaxID=100035 RepID=A0A7C8MB12_9PLEO|nr:hypothetical protein BDV95DRAFT_673020 [Massariosphaeria phaeospora]